MATFVLLFSGCGALRETFGREYILVDEFFDQFEADLRSFFSDISNELEFTPEDIRDMNRMLDETVAVMNLSRDIMKSRLGTVRTFMSGMGLDGQTARYVEVWLNDMRNDMIEEMIRPVQNTIYYETGIHFRFGGAEIDRGFFGSIWLLIRRHWVITIILICVAFAVFEKIKEFVENSVTPKAESSKTNGSEKDNEGG